MLKQMKITVENPMQPLFYVCKLLAMLKIVWQPSFHHFCEKFQIEMRLTHAHTCKQTAQPKSYTIKRTIQINSEHIKFHCKFNYHRLFFVCVKAQMHRAHPSKLYSLLNQMFTLRFLLHFICLRFHFFFQRFTPSLNIMGFFSLLKNFCQSLTDPLVFFFFLSLSHWVNTFWTFKLRKQKKKNRRKKGGKKNWDSIWNCC